MKHTNKKGFTIVELVIVIAVIAILAAVLIPNLSRLVDKANESKALQEAKSAYEAYLVTEDATTHKTPAENLDTIYLKITCGNYTYYVTGGQFNTTQNNGTTYTAMTVTNGELTK